MGHFIGCTHLWHGEPRAALVEALSSMVALDKVNHAATVKEWDGGYLAMDHEDENMIVRGKWISQDSLRSTIICRKCRPAMEEEAESAAEDEQLLA